MAEEEVEIEVGQVLVATGYDAFDPTPMAQYGYGRLDNIYSGLDVERMLNATGPREDEFFSRTDKRRAPWGSSTASVPGMRTTIAIARASVACTRSSFPI
jgi:heterodisulfide reductase subunit A-like polyferredoxin